jgi:hypothetical protein
VAGWPDYIGIVDASGHGVGGVVFGELSACTPVVFRWEWSDNIKQEIIREIFKVEEKYEKKIQAIKQETQQTVQSMLNQFLKS